MFVNLVCNLSTHLPCFIQASQFACWYNTFDQGGFEEHFRLTGSHFLKTYCNAMQGGEEKKKLTNLTGPLLWISSIPFCSYLTDSKLHFELLLKILLRDVKKSCSFASLSQLPAQKAVVIPCHAKKSVQGVSLIAHVECLRCWVVLLPDLNLQLKHILSPLNRGWSFPKLFKHRNVYWPHFSPPPSNRTNGQLLGTVPLS